MVHAKSFLLGSSYFFMVLSIWNRPVFNGNGVLPLDSERLFWSPSHY